MGVARSAIPLVGHVVRLDETGFAKNLVGKERAVEWDKGSTPETWTLEHLPDSQNCERRLVGRSESLSQKRSRPAPNPLMSVMPISSVIIVISETPGFLL
jgi:hypothetical protein